MNVYRRDTEKDMGDFLNKPRRKYVFLGGLIFTALLIVGLFVFAAPSRSQILPDPFLTPGKANAVLTQDVICTPGFRTPPYRHVTESRKKEVFKRYNIPYADHSQYEVDHLISIELGGSNDIENLWPEAYAPVPGAHQKDLVENYLHRAVCDGTFTLEEAQKEIATNWVGLYRSHAADKANDRR